MKTFSLANARDLLVNKEISALELIEATLERCSRFAHLNALITPTPEQALAAAKVSDARRAKGKAGLMEGLPIAIKDMFCTEGIRTTAGSKMLENFVPTYESTVTTKLKIAGSISVGKANQDEFAMGSANNTSYYGNCINPWTSSTRSEAQLVPGGSSGGSAVAVAAGMALGATGTDTGGSIRQPASFCGITGLKPTYGRCSRWGIIAFASSLDQAGPMTQDVCSAALMLQAMAGYDAKDSTSIDIDVPNYAAALNQSFKGLRIGIAEQYQPNTLPDDIRALHQQGQDWLKAAGAEIVPISMPYTDYALPTYYIVGLAECSSNLSRYDGVRYGYRTPDASSLDDMYMRTRAEGFGSEVRRRVLLGTYVLSAGYYDAYYLRAQKVRTLIAQDFHHAFRKCDLILTSTTPSAAFAHGEKMDDPISMYLNDVFTVPASLSGLPAISIPAGLSADHLPLGLQLIGKPFDEATVLRGGKVLEDAAKFTYLSENDHE
ncbi:MAG: Asp-tRNA(Asn)/Glu-tRNA(Gln) amidotransferase subunit GatA [Alphaproteobacteria bacterium]|nr:Asp-tRNA(Asn)/Glu-tRNA(Gln) amidotransferase subunit GatA [Alphaproteobacteria bacterium]